MIPLSDDTRIRRFPFATLALIAANLWVYFGWQEQVGIEESVQLAGFVPIELTRHLPGGLTHLFTAMFMHGGLMHLAGNLWFLWIFGRTVESDTGLVRFLAFYLLAGVAATLAHTWSEPLSRLPLVGASGAISGVLGAYLVKHPTASIRTFIPIWIFFRIVEIPACLFLFIWIGIQVLSQAAAHGHRGGGVAFMAHIGGFVAGSVLILLLQERDSRRREVE